MLNTKTPATDTPVLGNEIERSRLRFGKTRASSVAVIRVLLTFVGSFMNPLNAERKEAGQAKITQYDAIRAMFNSSGEGLNIDVPDVALMDFAAKVNKVRGVKTIPSPESGLALFRELSEYYANHPDNQYVTWDELNGAQVAAEVIASAPEIVEQEFAVV